MGTIALFVLAGIALFVLPALPLKVLERWRQHPLWVFNVRNKVVAVAPLFEYERERAHGDTPVRVEHVFLMPAKEGSECPETFHCHQHGDGALSTHNAREPSEEVLFHVCVRQKDLFVPHRPAEQNTAPLGRWGEVRAFKSEALAAIRKNSLRAYAAWGWPFAVAGALRNFRPVYLGLYFLFCLFAGLSYVARTDNATAEALTVTTDSGIKTITKTRGELRTLAAWGLSEGLLRGKVTRVQQVSRGIFAVCMETGRMVHKPNVLGAVPEERCGVGREQKVGDEVFARSGVIRAPEETQDIRRRFWVLLTPAEAQELFTSERAEEVSVLY